MDASASMKRFHSWVAGKSTSKTWREASAEDYILRDAAGDGLGKLIFSEAAAGGHEAAEVLSDGVAGALDIADVAAADEGQRDGVVEDAGILHELMGGSANGDAEGGAAGLAVFHEFYRNWRRS
jgi:hypothetical protein